jgi:CBS domain-containing protein
MAVERILATKGSSVITASATDEVIGIARKLAEHRIGAVVVCDALGAIQGIISERDIVRAVAAEGDAALHRPASAIMTKNVKTCRPGDSEAELMALMTEHRIRHLPVSEKGRLVGMISIGDVVKNRIEAIEQEAEQMKAYIATAG